MRKLRHYGTQRVIDVNLPRGIVDMIVTSNNMGDLHINIVNDYAKIICWNTICTHNH